MSIFASLEALRQRPIPNQAPVRAARDGFRNRIAIDVNHDLFGQDMVEAGTVGLAGRNYYAQTRNPPYWRAIDGATDKLLLRQSVAQRLAQVNRRAGEAGLELYLFDAWRPRAIQAYFHDVWMPAEL